MQTSGVIMLLPSIASGLGVWSEVSFWVPLSPLAVLAVSTPVVAGLADSLGRRRLFIAGGLLFSITSLLCGFSNAGYGGVDLLVYQAFKGFGAALVVVNSDIVVGCVFQQTAVAPMAVRINHSAAALGFGVGPLVAGAVSVQWRWFFFLGALLASSSSVLAALFLPLRREAFAASARRAVAMFDWLGWLCFAVMLLTLLLSLSLAAFPLGSLGTALICSFAAVCLVAFIVLATFKEERAFVDFSLLKNGSFFALSLSNVCISFAFFTILVLSIFYLQLRFGQTAFSGALLVPLGGGAWFALCIQSAVQRSHRRLHCCVVGALLAVVGIVGFTFLNSITSAELVSLVLFFVGAGYGLCGYPSFKAAVSCCAPASRRAAATILMLGSFLSFSISFAVASILVITNISTDNLFVGVSMGRQASEFVMKGIQSSAYVALTFAGAAFLLSAAVLVFVWLSAATRRKASLHPDRQEIQKQSALDAQPRPTGNGESFNGVKDGCMSELESPPRAVCLQQGTAVSKHSFIQRPQP
eukprot:GILJ01024094.1.p1 GENE.GILJ01024094.1~~GILJ01024094.1.p1  ORF type:complete len:594 (+),score=79.55 GILJ01024094.1:204-1784(+)